MSRGPRKRKTRPRAARSARRGTLRLGVVLGLLVALNLYVFLWRGGTSLPDVMKQAETATPGQKVVGASPSPKSAGESGDDLDDGPTEAPTPADEVDAPADDVGRWVEGTVQATDSLGKILKRENLAAPAADELIRALDKHLDMRAIKLGQTYRIHFDDADRVVEFELHVSKLETVRASRGPDGTLASEKVATATEVKVAEVGGTIGSSLYQAIKDAGEDTSLVGFFVDVFAYDLDFYTDTQGGDRFRMIVEKHFVGGKFLHYGRVLAAEYAGRAGTFRAFYWQAPGAREGRYYDDKGQSVERTLLKSPIKFTRVSSGFNLKRMHPILHVQRGHFGVDFPAPIGTPIWAAASGRIGFRGKRGGAGNCVILEHDGGLTTLYMHMSKFRKGQEVGQRVRAKEVIGYVGTTGLSTGPHLHFGVKVNGHYVDPLKMKMSRGAGVSKKERPGFETDTARLVSRLSQIPTGSPAVTPSAPATPASSAR